MYLGRGEEDGNLWGTGGGFRSETQWEPKEVSGSLWPAVAPGALSCSWLGFYGSVAWNVHSSKWAHFRESRSSKPSWSQDSVITSEKLGSRKPELKKLGLLVSVSGTDEKCLWEPWDWTTAQISVTCPWYQDEFWKHSVSEAREFLLKVTCRRKDANLPWVWAKQILQCQYFRPIESLRFDQIEFAFFFSLIFCPQLKLLFRAIWDHAKFCVLWSSNTFCKCAASMHVSSRNCLSGEHQMQ